MYKNIAFYKLDKNRVYYFNDENEYNDIIKEIIDNIHKYTIVKRNGDYYYNKKNKKYNDDTNGDLISSYRTNFIIEIKFKENFNTWGSQGFLFISNKNIRNELYDYLTQ